MRKDQQLKPTSPAPGGGAGVGCAVYAVHCFLRTTDLALAHPLRQRLGGGRERVAAFLTFAHAYYLAAGWGRQRLRGTVLVGELVVQHWEQQQEGGSRG